MALGRRQGSSSDLRARGRNSSGTEWKAEGGCVGRHVFYPVTPSPKLGRTLGLGGPLGEGGGEEVTDASLNPAVAWTTLGLPPPVSGLQKFPGASFW